MHQADYIGEIEPRMRFLWGPDRVEIEVTRISHKIPGEPWVYARVIKSPDTRQIGREYGNDMDRFREAVVPAPQGADLSSGLASDAAPS